MKKSLIHRARQSGGHDTGLHPARQSIIGCGGFTLVLALVLMLESTLL